MPSGIMNPCTRRLFWSSARISSPMLRSMPSSPLTNRTLLSDFHGTTSFRLGSSLALYSDALGIGCGCWAAAGGSAPGSAVQATTSVARRIDARIVYSATYLHAPLDACPLGLVQRGSLGS